MKKKENNDQLTPRVKSIYHDRSLIWWLCLPFHRVFINRKRAPRREFLVIFALYLCISTVTEILSAIYVDHALLILFISVPFGLALLFTLSRRFMDIGCSPNWAVVPFFINRIASETPEKWIGYLQLLVLVVIGLIPGQKKTNRYGPDPLITEPEVTDTGSAVNALEGDNAAAGASETSRSAEAAGILSSTAGEQAQFHHSVDDFKPLPVRRDALFADRGSKEPK